MPRPAPTTAPAAAQASPVAGAGQSGAAADAALRVLLVDDEPDVREVAQQMLEILGCKVQAVGSAEAAERALREAPFDLLLTDISLPGRDGLQLARAAREQHPGMRVVLSSGYGQGRSEPGLWTLPKPYGLPELQALVERVQAHETA